MKRNGHFNVHLQRSFNKYGITSFNFRVLEFCERELLDSKEKYWIYFFSSMDSRKGFNLIDDPITTHHSKQTREKISRARIGMKFSDEHRENIRKARLGTKSTEETKAKLREIHKNPPLGENAANVKITNEMATLIIVMLANKIRIRDITKVTKVNYNLIKAIKHRRSWVHISKYYKF